MKSVFWGCPTTFTDNNGIPVHIGDTIRTNHFVHYKRRRQIFMYHVVVGAPADPRAVPLSQVITDINDGGNASLSTLLHNWSRIEVIADAHQDGGIAFYDRTRIPK